MASAFVVAGSVGTAALAAADEASDVDATSVQTTTADSPVEKTAEPQVTETTAPATETSEPEVTETAEPQVTETASASPTIEPEVEKTTEPEVKKTAAPSASPTPSGSPTSSPYPTSTSYPTYPPNVPEPDLIITKTVDAAVDREYFWTLEKGVNDGAATVAEGEYAAFEYTVTAIPSGFEDSNFRMSGEITVENPGGFPVYNVEITDQPLVGGGATCEVEQDVFWLDAGQSATMTYVCSFTSQPKLKGANKATVSWEDYWYETHSSSIKVPVKFAAGGENRTVEVYDDLTTGESPGERLGEATWNAKGEATVFTYILELPGGAPGECAEHTNIARIPGATGPDGEEPTAEETVVVCTEEPIDGGIEECEEGTVDNGDGECEPIGGGIDDCEENGSEEGTEECDEPVVEECEEGTVDNGGGECEPVGGGIEEEPNTGSTTKPVAGSVTKPGTPLVPSGDPVAPVSLGLLMAGLSAMLVALAGFGRALRRQS